LPAAIAVASELPAAIAVASALPAAIAAASELPAAIAGASELPAAIAAARVSAGVYLLCVCVSALSCERYTTRQTIYGRQDSSMWRGHQYKGPDPKFCSAGDSNSRMS
jgi:hypothetical protein